MAQPQPSPNSRYFGKVCARHPELNGERRKVNRSCPACSNEKRVAYARLNPEDKAKKAERTRRYAAANKPAQTEKMRRWRLANPERDKKNSLLWLEKNAERKRATSKNFRENNRHKVNWYAATRRALKLNATPTWANTFFIEEAYLLAKVRERVCGGAWEVDHIVPLRSPIVCGLHVDGNLQVIPIFSNRSKGNRYWPHMPEIINQLEAR